MSKLDNLLSDLDHAIARAPKRRPKRTRSGEVTAAGQRVLFIAAEDKAREAKVTLDAADRQAERAYYRRVGKLAALGKRYTAARKALEGVEWGSVECARLLNYARVINEARGRIFDLPIVASDIADGGRFYRRAKWLGLEVGMLAVDEEDVVAGAVELCYIKGQTAENERGELMPTLGAMYRNLKLYYHGQLDRFRRNKSAGVVAIHSLDALVESMGDQWLEDNAHRLDNLGFGYADPTEYPAVMVPIDQLADSRAALHAASAERNARSKRAQAEAAIRDTLAEGAREPEGYDRASFDADRKAIRVLINGGTVAMLAEHFSVAEKTITARLLALEGMLGATPYSSVGSEPVSGSEVRGTAHVARDVPAERPVHRHTGWKAPRNGAKASPVLISHK